MTDIEKLQALRKNLDETIMRAAASSMDMRNFTGVYNHLVAARSIINNVIHKEKDDDNTNRRTS